MSSMSLPIWRSNPAIIDSQTGVERKATCRGLFSKLLYLAESEELLPGADAETRRSLVADVFGATEDDAAQLRIVSLYEVATLLRIISATLK